jgi:hypothetical protein
MTEPGRFATGSGRFGSGRETGVPVSDMTLRHIYDSPAYRSPTLPSSAGSVAARWPVARVTVDRRTWPYPALPEAAAPGAAG